MSIHLEVWEARSFAKGAHSAIGQKRKYTGEPYWVHPEEVVRILNRMPMVKIDGDYRPITDDVLCAAWLHDVVEDTSVTFEDIEEAFDEFVAQLVREVTDVSKPSDGNRAARKEIDRNHLTKASFWGKTIKLADLIDNTRTIIQHDPSFARVYLKEKQALLEVLKDGHPFLFERASNIVQENLHLVV